MLMRKRGLARGLWLESDLGSSDAFDSRKTRILKIVKRLLIGAAN